ncbi:AAA family ATPase [Methanospirillum stamsii]|uniref:Nitrogen fixation protein NifH n=1 Tax=Methanospirillum stamsii TaxID=1277351 RepID=A0A2V2N7C8_9EURY|nr:nitrogenase iron protein NifH [Methanospirillum stamsii]PWR74550.1 nitrogen fixation protein NifH [Methanospirillum stamsii]
MKKIAIYGKGGIGKSTVTSSLSAALSVLGYRVMQIGCDPKADSTINLTNGQRVTPVMNYLREFHSCSSLDEISLVGYNGIVCVEAGGPIPGLGCAGRGIITTFNTLESLQAYEIFKPDFVLYDVLGDVVCGGFAMPLREGYADEVIIVTSGEKMSLYAANNIKKALDNFENRNYAKLKGLIMNCRNIENEEEIVTQFAKEIDSPIIGNIPRSSSIQYWEERNMTPIQGDVNCIISCSFLEIASQIAGTGKEN